MSITFEFATQDDCLDKMVPSDLRRLVSERDAALAQNAEAFGDGYYDGFIDGAKHQDDVDLNTKTPNGIAAISSEAMRCSEIAEGNKSTRAGIVSRQELLAQNAELVAKIDAIKDAWMAAGSWPDTVEEKQVIANAINAATTQCLRDVKAEAGRAGFVACAELMNEACANMDDVWSERQVSFAANEYAERVKQEK